MKYKKKKLEIFFFGIVLPVVGYFVIFYRSDAPPLFIWDEASYATNALEMVLSNDYISLRRHDGITLYSTKLPLVIWLQSLCIRIFGINELAIRLPSLLAGSGTVFMLVFFGKKVLRSSIIGFFSGLTLLASFAFMNNHIVRSGDLDAMLTFFITLYSLLLFTFLLKKETDFNSFLPWLSFAIIAAFYTKSIAGFMPLLGLFFTGVTSTRRKEIFSNYKTYLYGWVVLVICGAYYYVREKAAAGYLDKIFYSEYSRMTENVMPYHNKHFIYYVRRMGVERFYPFIYFIPFALWLGAKSKTEIIKKATIYIAITSVTYLGLISFSVVKLDWYDAPLYPFFSILVGILIDELVKKAQQSISTSVSLGLISLIFVFPIYKIINFQAHRTGASDPLEYEGHFVRELGKNLPEFDDYSVLEYSGIDELLDGTRFYIKARNIEDHAKIDLVKHISQLKKNQVLVCQPEKKDSIERMYNYEVITTSDRGCKLYRLQDKKEKHDK